MMLWIIFFPLTVQVNEGEIPRDWFKKAIEYIKKDEYRPNYINGRLHIWNREGSFQAYFDEERIEILPREGKDWKINLNFFSPCSPKLKKGDAPGSDTIFYGKNWIYNSEDGLILCLNDISYNIEEEGVTNVELKKVENKIYVKGLPDTPSWTADPTNQAEAYFGYSVSTAGDVNGDGYSDVIIGAARYNAEYTREGRVYVYYGTPTGLPSTPSWSIDPTDQSYAYFGHSVSTAGDVNGDGYSDVIIGASRYDGPSMNEGRVYVYYGTSTGLRSDSLWSIDPTDQSYAYFGHSVSTAGDVNGDGYSDVIIGAYSYDADSTNEGRVYVYYGTSTGLRSDSLWTIDPTDQEEAYFGHSVSTAGDVNGDGYSDIIIGARSYDGNVADEGGVYVYYGSGTAPFSTSWIAHPTNEEDARFGSSVSTAGDVNGDGYSDVIIGASHYNAEYTNEGRVYAYYGTPTGLPSTPSWSIDPTDQSDAYFGYSVSTAGDVNGDGYSDVIIGAYGYTHEYDEGRVYVYYGAPTGLSTTPSWYVDPANENEAHFGYSVCTAGDVNGDGYSDIIIGAYRYNNDETDEGRAYVYYGASDGLPTDPSWFVDPINQAEAYFGYSVSTAGDVNGDGYSDVIIGALTYDNDADNEGRAYVYHGSPDGLSSTPSWFADPTDQENAYFARSVSTAGDVNGDGYSDVIIGAHRYDNEELDEGRAYVYYGSEDGLPSTPSWTADPTDNEYADFGTSVSTAGDVNGDGYSDVIIGAWSYDGNMANEGRVYVYYGSEDGLPSTPSWFADPTNQVGASFGTSVSTAGDVNGDGYSDVIIGALTYNNDADYEGRAYVYHGSPDGLLSDPSWFVDPTNQQWGYFGASVSIAGDVNGDGYSDVIIGAYYYDNEEINEGRAYVYYGSEDGLPSTPSWTADPTNQGGAYFGYSVSTAGDVNGDGYSDVIIDAHGYDNEENREGRAYVYYGSEDGLPSTSSWTVDPTNQAGARFGYSVSTAGDVNGDGYSDVIIGARYYDNEESNEGRAYVYYGSSGGGVSIVPRQGSEGGARKQLLSRIEGNRVRIRLLGKMIGGRGRVKVRIEVKPLLTQFNNSGTIENEGWFNTGVNGVEVDVLSGTLSDGFYHWRARLVYHPIDYHFGLITSRWISIQGKESSGWEEQDIKVGNPTGIEGVQVSVFPGDKCIILKWRTDIEFENTEWIITRAIGSEEKYEEIVRIPGKGASVYTYIDSLVSPNTLYYYKLGMERSGRITWHGPFKAKLKEEKRYSLKLSPNIFKDKVSIRYEVPGWEGGKGVFVSLKIYNKAGQLIRTLINKRQKPGIYTITWDAKDENSNFVSSGTYFCEFRANGRIVKKLIYIEKKK